MRRAPGSGPFELFIALIIAFCVSFTIVNFAISALVFITSTP